MHIFDSTHVASNQSYGVYGNVRTGKGTGKYGRGIEITSGGPGSNPGKCCGITVGIKADTRKPFIATEDWTEPAFSNGKHTYLCGGSQSGLRAPDCEGAPINIPIYNNSQGIPISWHVDFKTKPGHVIYCGRLDNKPGCGPGYFAAFTDPRYKGKLITPNGINLLGNDGKPAKDLTRPANIISYNYLIILVITGLA